MFTYSSPTDRAMSRLAMVILLLGGLYGTWSLGQPMYWRFYATVLRPFEDHSTDAHTAEVALGDDPFTAVAIQAAGGHSTEMPKQEGNSGAAAALAEPRKLEETNNAAGEGTADAAAAEVKAETAAATKIAADAAKKARAEKAKSDRADAEKAKAAQEVAAAEKAKSDQEAAAAATKPFNVEDYPLTKERVHPLLENGVIMVTWANHHYLDFARSWVAQVRKSGISGYLVGAMDDDMLKDLVAHGVHTWRMNTGITKNDLGWGSANFHKMGRWKIALIKQFLELDDLTVVISDIDTAWVQNPMPFFQRYPEADILTSTDQLGPTVQDDSLERFPDAGSSFNIGIMLFRPGSKKFVDEWIKVLEDPKMWDQTAFNDLSRRGHTNSQPPKNLWKGYDKQLTFGVLPSSLFASGHTYFVQHKYEEFGLKPYVAHATFQYSGTPGKRHRFREALLWEDPPEYFDHAKGFITFTNDIPQPLIDKAAEELHGPVTEAMLDSHFALVNHQLLKVRAAMAIATITGRVLIMPAVKCQLDKYWAPLGEGNIPGSKFIKPFICPMDHIFDIEGNWNLKRPESEWGPHIEWREHSFLQNPRLTPAVNSSRVRVETCSAGSADCCDGSAPAVIKDGVIKLQPDLNSEQLQRALLSIAGSKILDFASIATAFSSFSQPEHQQRWVRRLNHATSVMCCMQTQPGWIWYDMFWDIPHQDRFGRKHEVFGRPYHRGDSHGRGLLSIDSSSWESRSKDSSLAELTAGSWRGSGAVAEGEGDGDGRRGQIRRLLDHSNFSSRRACDWRLVDVQKDAMCATP